MKDNFPIQKTGDEWKAILAAKGAEPGAFQVTRQAATERPVNLLELAQVLVRVRGGGTYELVDFPRHRKAIDIGDYYADYSKIRDGLGWEPEVPLEDGLARSLSFYGEHGEHYWNADI